MALELHISAAHAQPFPGYVVEAEALCVRRTRALVRAVRQRDGARVVLKKLAGEPPDAKSLEKLRREFRVMSAVACPHVLRAHELVETPQSAAIVLEDIDGRSLDRIVAEEGPVPLERLLPVAVCVASALASVHAREIVHRDVTSGNVIVSASGDEVRLADFGLAGFVQDTYIQAEMEGSLAFMAPEQTKRVHGIVDHRSDLYSFGVTLYHCLTGRLPFTGDAMSVIHGHIARAAPPAASLRPEAPEALCRIVAKLMEKDPEQRYQSAHGVREDLRRCLEVLRGARAGAGAGEAPPAGPGFELGRHDFSSALQLPDRLFGREELLRRLADAHTAAERAGRAAAFVGGPSGAGKTRLVAGFVEELAERAAERAPGLLRGKYDAGACARPYSALVVAVAGHVRSARPAGLGPIRASLASDWRPSQLLADGERLAAARARAVPALGDSAPALVDFIPETRHLFPGAPLGPAVPLPPAEAALRLSTAFCALLAALRPLVLFLDDVQWADPASLKLIRDLLASPAVGCLLVLAFRSNEVPAGHPVAHAMREIRESGVHVEELEVGPLGEGDANALLASALRCPPEAAAPLARLVHAKTGGNPFFIRSFLATLHSERKIRADVEAGAWRWDVAEIEREGYTDNVVDMLVGFIGHLDPGTQRALKVAALLGNTFGARLLAAAAGLPMTAVRAALAAARRSRLVDAASPSGGVHRFVHDRVQQACSCLVPPEELPALHLQIGRRLLAARGGGGEGEARPSPPPASPGPEGADWAPDPDAEADSEPGPADVDVQELAAHYNRGERLVSDPAERRRLAELNARAGATAADSTAYEAARAFFAAGVRALRAPRPGAKPEPEDGDPLPEAACLDDALGDPASRPLALSLLLRLVEAEYQCGDVPAALRHLAAAETRAGTRRERLDAARLRLNILSASNQFEASMRCGLQMLGEYGVYLSAEGHPTPDEIAAAHEGVRGALRARGLAVPDLAGLPLGAAEVDGDLHRLLTNAVEVVPVLYLLARFELYQVLVAAVARLCVESGRGGDAAAPWLAIHGFSLSGFQYLYEEGESFVRAAAALSARDGVSDFCRGRTAVFLFAPFPMGETWCEKLPALATGFTASAAVGDFNNALYVLNQYHWVSFFHGKPLAENAAFAARHEAFVRKCVNHELEQSVVAASRHYSVLLGGEGPGEDAEALLAAADMGPEAAQRGYYMRATYFSFRFVTLLALGRFREAAAAFPAFAAVVPYNAGMIFGIEFAWFEGLYELTARLGFWPGDAGDGGGEGGGAALTEEERAAAAAIGRASVDHLRVLASHNRIYTCRSLFLEAELGRLLAPTPAAALASLPLYEAAGAAAREARPAPAQRLPRPASSQGSGAGPRPKKNGERNRKLTSPPGRAHAPAARMLARRRAGRSPRATAAAAAASSASGSGSASSEASERPASFFALPVAPARPGGGRGSGSSGKSPISPLPVAGSFSLFPPAGAPALPHPCSSAAGAASASASGLAVTRGGGGGGALSVDLLTVVRTALALAAEEDLEALLSRLLLLAIENAGATTAALVLRSNKRCRHGPGDPGRLPPDSPAVRYCVEEEGGPPPPSPPSPSPSPSPPPSEGASARVRCIHVPLEEYAGASPAVLDYVLRAGERVCLPNAAAAGDFVSCRHVRQAGVKSVLALPVVYQMEMMGLLALQLAVALLNGTLREELTANNRELEAQNRQLAMLDAAKDALLANTSHELRTPCGAIIGMTELLMDSGPLTEQQAEAARTVHQSAEHLLRIINNFLDLSVLESGAVRLEAAELDLEALVDACVAAASAQAHRAGLEVGAAVDPRCPRRLVGDPTRLTQVLSNLLSNAVKFSSGCAGGEGDPPGILVTVTFVARVGAECVVRVEVEDSGVGIKQEDLPKLFQRFSQVDSSFSRRWEGSGLGLAISKTIVERCAGREPASSAEHGAGTISVRSQFGKGSVFSFTVALEYPPGASPGSEAGVPPAPPEPDPPEHTAGPVAVPLLARPFLRSLLERFLEGAGARAAPCGAAGELAPLAARLAGEGARVPCALLDLACRGAPPPSPPGCEAAGPPLVAILPGDGRAPPAGPGPDPAACLRRPVSRAAVAAELARRLQTPGPGPGPGQRPAEPAPAQPAAASPPRARAPHRPLRFLVVEDNPVNQAVARRLLERAGHAVDVAGDGLEALARLAAAPRPYHLLWMGPPLPSPPPPPLLLLF
eukprot:tig00020684_g12846.t1